MSTWPSAVLLVVMVLFALVNTALAVEAHTPRQTRVATVGLACEVVALAAFVVAALR